MGDIQMKVLKQLKLNELAKWNLRKVLAIEKLNTWTSTSFPGILISWLKAGFSLDLIPVIKIKWVFFTHGEKTIKLNIYLFVLFVTRVFIKVRGNCYKTSVTKKIQDYTFVTLVNRFYIMVHCNVFLESFLKT